MKLKNQFKKRLLVQSCLVLLSLFLTSCQILNAVFADQHVLLENSKTNNKELKYSGDKTNNLSAVKVSVYSVVNAGDLIGYRIQPNINNATGQGGVFIKNDPNLVLEQKAKEQIRLQGFKIVDGTFDKSLKLKLMYLTYKTKGGGFSISLICNIAIKATIYDNKGKSLYQKWYFVSKEFSQNQYHKLEVTTKNINESFNEITGDIFTDNAMITHLKK